MTFLLSSHNIFKYLIKKGICEPTELPPSQIKSKSAKNFNLLVDFANDRHLLVKQERFYDAKVINNEFTEEWRIHQWLKTFSEVNHISSMISEAIFFDDKNSIIIFNYLANYCDLDDYYTRENNFVTIIAEQIGKAIATIHRCSLDREDYQQFLFLDNPKITQNPNFLRGLRKIKPEVFAWVTNDNLKFFKLYQRYASFEQAIAQLQTVYQRRCLIHNDFKLSNILLDLQWQRSLTDRDSLSQNMVRLIDWEKCTWGDPGHDLGRIIASYLDLWLSSLVVSTDIDIATALRLAKTPLESIQPSINALIKAYFDHFPEILIIFPDFLTRVIQFTGLALFERVQINVDYHEPFGNRGVCMLQVAKTLLCNPEQSLSTIFGSTVSELTAA
jgi:thiamine kinase-like enzyme